MKYLKFKHDFIKEILEGRKVSTWRLFDDKDLRVNDKFEVIDSNDNNKFGEAVITNIKEKTIKDLTDDELKKHQYNNKEDMMESHKKYYEDKVNLDTIVKIIDFKLI